MGRNGFARAAAAGEQMPEGTGWVHLQSKAGHGPRGGSRQ